MEPAPGGVSIVERDIVDVAPIKSCTVVSLGLETRRAACIIGLPAGQVFEFSLRVVPYSHGVGVLDVIDIAPVEHRPHTHLHPQTGDVQTGPAIGRLERACRIVPEDNTPAVEGDVVDEAAIEHRPIVVRRIEPGCVTRVVGHIAGRIVKGPLRVTADRPACIAAIALVSRGQVDIPAVVRGALVRDRVADVIGRPAARVSEVASPIISQQPAVVCVIVRPRHEVYIVSRVDGPVVAFGIQAARSPRVIRRPTGRVLKSSVRVVSQHLTVATLVVQLRRKVHVPTIADRAEESLGVQPVGRAGIV